MRNVDRQIVTSLRRAGHSVSYVSEVDPGISDEQVLKLSRQAEAILITADKDFGELVFSQQLIHTGILLVRLQGCSSEEKARIVVDAVNRFWIGDWNGFRRRQQA